MKTYEQLKKEFGTVEYKGKTLALTQMAYADNYGTDGEVRYYSGAIDEDGNKYTVTWETTLEWDEAGELFALEQAKEEGQNFDEEDQERMDELEAKGVQSYLIQDESDACDWDNPIGITEN